MYTWGSALFDTIDELLLQRDRYTSKRLLQTTKMLQMHLEKTQKELIGFKKELLFNRYSFKEGQDSIRGMQLQIVNLLYLVKEFDGIKVVGEGRPGGQAGVDLSSLAAILQDLLFFLESHFLQYMDLGCVACNSTAAKMNIQRDSLVLRLVNNLTIHPIVDREFQLTKRWLPEIALVFSSSFALKQGAYVLELLGAFERLLKETPERNLLAEIEILFLQYNYNAPWLFANRISQLQEKLAQITSSKEKRVFLLGERKRLRQVILLPDKAFEARLPYLRDQLVGWIEEEIQYTEALLTTNNVSKQKSLTSNAKTTLNLPVAQVGCLLRLLVDGKLLVHNNYSALMRQVADSFRTSHTEEISEKSLRIKFYNVEKASVDAVRELLFKLIHLSRKI